MKRLGGWWRLWIFLSVLWGMAVVTFVIADWPGNVAKRVLSEEDMKLLSPQTLKLLADAKKKDNALPDNLFDEPSKPRDLIAEIEEAKGKTKAKPWERFQKAEDAAKSPKAKPWESAPAEHRVEGNKPSYTVGGPDDPYMKFSTPVKPAYIPAPDELLLIPYVMRSGQELRLLCGTESLDAVKQDYERVQGLTLRNARLSKVGYALLVLLIPCLAILALGLSSRWVVRGFKKEPI